jgi:hypothetical protein
MSDRRKLSQIAVAAILAFAVATPTAFAMPFKEAQQMDLHASTVQPQSQTQVDLRGEHSKSPSDTAPVVGLPVFPTYVGPAPASQVAVADDGTDVEWPVIGIGIAAALLLGAGLGIAAYKSRSPKPAH